MFGVVQKDNTFSNLTVSSNTTVGKVSTPGFIQPVSTGYPSTPTGPYSVIVIPPFDNTSAPVTYNLTVNSAESVVGDQVIFLFKPVVQDGNDVIVNLPSNVKVLQQQTYLSEIIISNYLEYNLTLLYNGTDYVNTFETC